MDWSDLILNPKKEGPFQDVLKELDYNSLVHLCELNSSFRDFCKTDRFKQVIQSKQKKWRVSILTITGASLFLDDLKYNVTFGEIKWKVYETYGPQHCMPPEYTLLIFAGKQLKDEDKIKNVIFYQSYATLHLITKSFSIKSLAPPNLNKAVHK